MENDLKKIENGRPQFFGNGRQPLKIKQPKTI